MKFLTIFIVTVFSFTVIAFFSTYACSGFAFADAWVTSNSSYVYSSISATDAKRGGYSISCTGRTTRAMAYRGTTSDSMSMLHNTRKSVSASASVGGACEGGGGFQDYDYDSAGP